MDNEPGKATICRICVKTVARYTCPRCQLRYCSLACYKSADHVACSEGFYQECCEEAMQEMHAPPDQRRAMLQMLQRQAHEDLDSDDDEEEDDMDDEEDLTERLHGLDLDRDIDRVWEVLTPSEQRQFRRLVESGDMGSLPVWQPWWVQRPVEEVGLKSTAPKLVQVKIMSELLPGKEPNPMIRFSLVGVLLGYAYMSRYFNGDHHDMPIDATEGCLLRICPTLSGQLTLSTVSESIGALVSALGSSQNTSEDVLPSSSAMTIALVEDARTMVVSQCAALAISDVIRLLRSARKSQDGRGGKYSSTSKLKKDSRPIFLAQKKAEFLLSWLNCTNEWRDEIVTSLEIELCSRSSHLVSDLSVGCGERLRDTSRDHIDREAANERSKPIIEELS